MTLEEIAHFVLSLLIWSICLIAIGIYYVGTTVFQVLTNPS